MAGIIIVYLLRHRGSIVLGPPSVCVATPLAPQHTSVRTATVHSCRPLDLYHDTRCQSYSVLCLE